MAYQSVTISSYRTGLEKDLEPWKLIDDAFTEVENMIVFRDKLQKRIAPRLLGRLSLAISGESIGNKLTHYTGTLANTPIVPGTVIFTEDGFLQEVTDDSEGNLIGDVDPTGTNTINYLTGAYNVTFAAATGNVVCAYRYYPLLPVMGIHLRETTTTNVEETLFFDTRNAYLYNQVTGVFTTTNTANQTWTGSDSQFFTGLNYWLSNAGIKYFWTTNGKEYSLAGAVNQDGIKYYDGTNWATLRPIIYNDGADRYLNGAKVIIAFQGHLIIMNTFEDVGATSYNLQNKIRWCFKGDPTNVDAFRHDIIGKGSYETVPTNESILSATIVNGKCIVYTERSTYELAYTGNAQRPFIVRNISEEFGSESQFSTQLINESAVTFGQRAITGTDGIRVSRVDQKIPDDVFSISNLNEGKERVQSIRDYMNEIIYWTLADDNATYPNKCLVFNYQNGAYSYFQDNYSALGWFQKTSSYKWSTINKKWSECGFKWSDAITKAESPLVCGGNQRGFIHLFDFNTLDDISLDVTAVNVALHEFTCPSHNLTTFLDYFIVIEDLLGVSGYNEDKIYKVHASDANTIVVTTDEAWSGIYTGAGAIAILKPWKFKTKKFNPFLEQGNNIKTGYVDFYIDISTDGQAYVDFYCNDNNSKPSVKIDAFYTSKQHNDADENTKAWRRVSVYNSATNLQIEIGLNEDLLLSDNGLDIYKSNFILHAMRMWVAPAGSNIGLL